VLFDNIKDTQWDERFASKEALYLAVHECNTPKKWFCEAIRKLPIMAVMYGAERGVC
jgi:hypothetical protein